MCGTFTRQDNDKEPGIGVAVSDLIKSREAGAKLLCVPKCSSAKLYVVRDMHSGAYGFQYLFVDDGYPITDAMSEDLENPKKRRKQPIISLYDAVAGRVGTVGLLSQPKPSKHRDTISTAAGEAVPPDEVLFRRSGAPVRYAEHDLYFADRHLGSSQRLPHSDLLKALHRYAADFYGRAAEGEGERNFGSLDETALLALGILIEEAAAEAIGDSGDLALLETGDDNR